MKFLALFSVYLLASHVVFTATTPAKNCVLDANGIESCVDASLSLKTAARQSAPCAKNDMKCWCIKAKDYTNDVRRRRGVSKMLKVGPMSQLDNAVQYARVLGGKGFLQHQNLGEATRKVGCGRFIGGENIAFNFNSGDVAKACVDQWEGSPGHLANILRDRFEEVVVGFHFHSSGRVYCVQTFASRSSFGTTGSPSGPRCEAVRSGSGPGPTRPAPTRPPRTRPAATRPPRTRPAATRPARTRPTKKKPRSKPNMSKEMKDQANRSCRCIELGSKCWSSLQALSGNRCKSLTPAMKQSVVCKRICCGYCKAYPNTPPCMSRRVKSTCRKLQN